MLSLIINVMLLLFMQVGFHVLLGGGLKCQLQQKLHLIIVSVCSMFYGNTIASSKRVLHRMRTNASSFNFQYLLIFLRPFSSCCVFFLLFLSLCLSFSNVFQKAVLTQAVTNPGSLSSGYFS